MALIQNPQQGPPGPPKELDKYGIENVLPHVGPPLELSPAQMADIQKRAKLNQQAAALDEYRRTGQTSLSKAEIDDILDDWGIKKNQLAWIIGRRAGT